MAWLAGAVVLAGAATCQFGFGAVGGGAVPAPGEGSRLVSRAWSDAKRLGLGSPLVSSVVVVAAPVQVAEADPLSGVIKWPVSNYSRAPGWWQDSYARHEVAHLLTPGGGHGPTFRETWAVLLREIGVEAVYAPGEVYPTLVVVVGVGGPGPSGSGSFFFSWYNRRNRNFLFFFWRR